MEHLKERSQIGATRLQDGQSHTVKAQGILTIHGIAIEREIESTLQVGRHSLDRSI
jgi:hypothetical protein